MEHIVEVVINWIVIPDGCSGRRVHGGAGAG